MIARDQNNKITRALLRTIKMIKMMTKTMMMIKMT